MPKPEKRDEIVRAALEIIAEHGFHGAPMALIADKAAVGAGTIYRYFENKDVLITELNHELEERIFNTVTIGYSPKKPIRERYLYLGSAILGYFIANPVDFRFLEQFHNSPYGTDFRRDRLIGKREDRAFYRELFIEGVEQQVVKDFPLVVLCALTFGPLMAIARDHILGFICLDDRLITQTIEACWNGIKR